MNQPFLHRFQLIWSRKRRAQLGQALAGTFLVGLVAFWLISALDYTWELDQGLRTILGIVGLFVVVGFGAMALRSYQRRSGRPLTAAEIERAFPELGQSVRTSVEFGTMPSEQAKAEGVAANLVSALVLNTHQRALPLTLEDVIPANRFRLMAISGMIVGVLLLGVSFADWEWRNAAERTLLAGSAYRTLEVKPGNLLIDEGDGVRIEAILHGRANREVTVQTRFADKPDSEWTIRTLEKVATADDASNSVQHSRSFPTTRGRSSFVATLDWLSRPIEYQITAGELSSGPYRIDIRRPIQIKQLSIDLTPPSYTGLPSGTVVEGNLSVLQGTHARFNIQFDKVVRAARIQFAPRWRRRDSDPPAEVTTIEMQVTGDVATANFELIEDGNYGLFAEADDGTELVETTYRIRTREDQPPIVTIEEPTEAVEVHSLAELMMRIRVMDDYGLARAGIVFQINNEQEIPLIAKEFTGTETPGDDGRDKMLPKTQADLHKQLPLEVFELTQKDSVMYFAYAEDNRPGTPQRTETEMRFIDIRPFKREYNIQDPDPMAAMGMRPGLKSLEELIQRQRFGLNRTLQMEKRAAAGRNPDATSLDQLMKFETELAQNTADLAEGLARLGLDDTELLRQAEASMLAAVDSMSVAKWENATLQMRDALKALTEQRDRSREFILKNPDPGRLRQFDRMQAQKIRRPKTDSEEARELIHRLQELIQDEATVINGLPDSDSKPDQAEKPNPEAPASVPVNTETNEQK